MVEEKVGAVIRHRVDSDVDPAELYVFDDAHPVLAADVRWYVGCSICDRALLAGEAPTPPHRVVGGPSCGSGVDHCTCVVCWPPAAAGDYGGNGTTGVADEEGGRP